MRFYFIVSSFVSAAKGESRYQHDMIVLAEGLSELGHQCVGNTNYWPSGQHDPEFLIKKVPEQEAFHCDAVIMSGMYPSNHGGHLPQILQALKGQVPLIATECYDGFYTPAFSSEWKIFDLILKCHYNAHYSNPSHVVPWAFGISQRWLRAIEPMPWEQRQLQVLWNFRIGHGLRKLAHNEVMPYIPKPWHVDTTTNAMDHQQLPPEEAFWWAHSGGRHFPDYFQRLEQAKAVAAFGGGLIGPIQKNKLPMRLARKCIAALPPLAKRLNRVAYQWDSYRFWESLVAGAVVLNYDVFALGARLPVAAEAGQHFVGLPLHASPQQIQHSMQDMTGLKQIAETGRAWALQHYTPVPTAQRFLQLLVRLQANDSKQ